MENETVKDAEKFFYEKFGLTANKARIFSFTSIEMCRFAAGFHENEFKTKLLYNYSDVFENQEVINLLKEREEIESKILAIDTMAIVKHELQKLDQQ